MIRRFSQGRRCRGRGEYLASCVLATAQKESNSEDEPPEAEDMRYDRQLRTLPVVVHEPQDAHQRAAKPVCSAVVNGKARPRGRKPDNEPSASRAPHSSRSKEPKPANKKNPGPLQHDPALT